MQGRDTNHESDSNNSISDAPFQLVLLKEVYKVHANKCAWTHI